MQQYHFYCSAILTVLLILLHLCLKTAYAILFSSGHRYCLTTVTGRSGSVCVCGSPAGGCQCLRSSTRFFKSHGLEREEKKWVWIIGLLLKEWRREGTSERKWEWDGRNIKDKQILFHFPGHPRAAALVVIMYICASRTPLATAPPINFTILKRNVWSSKCFWRSARSVPGLNFTLISLRIKWCWDLNAA